MSENWKFQASPKISDIMYNVRGETAEEFAANLANFPFDAVAQFEANLKGGSALAQIVQPSAPAAPAAPSWPPAAQTAPPQQAAPPAFATDGGQGGCEVCGGPLIQKQTGGGKNVLRCDQWRWNNGNPNGHTSKFL